MIVEMASIVLVYVTYFAFAGKRLMTYMHVLQQEDYTNGRLWKWIRNNKAYDKRLSLYFIALGGAVVALQIFLPKLHLPAFLADFLIFVGFGMASYKEIDPRKNAKKKLVSTPRAKRIFFPAFIFLLLLGSVCFFWNHPWFWVVVIQIFPFVLTTTNMILTPFENIIQQVYWNEANTKVRELEPTVIGITGSFGKTSVKHILGHILMHQAPTLVTPGSVNTPMGITRIIREHLDETHKYLIVEMGAYGPGSIKRLCALTPPDYGIITSIGHAHYERFKSLDTVAFTKFELAQAVLEKEGKTVIHERTLRFPYPRSLKVDNPESFIVCGDPPEVDPQKQKFVSLLEQDDWHITKAEQHARGIDLHMMLKKKSYKFELPLYGLHHAHNAALAIALAMELEMGPLAIINALKTLPQIEHRLEVKRQPDGVTIIDDAFNSNPVGFHSALDLLKLIQTEGRSILITPGMVELGIAHNEAHEQVGAYAGEVCDICIVVAPKRIEAFIRGFKQTGGSKTLIEYDSFQEAKDWLAENRQEGDVVLIENDLPDMYERVPKM